ncbi:MAG: aminopeptidase P family protein [Ruminococcaceae bacterium]|nr:aminopeptidase P family protein [Oscillospiraceae bacterium]
MTRLAEIRRRMAESDVDGLLISDEVSASYLSGFDFSDGYLAILADAAYLVTDFRYTEAAEASVAGDFIVVEAKGGTLSEALDRLVRGGAKNVAFEENAVTVVRLDKMQSLADGKLTFFGKASAWLSEMRCVKSEDELLAIEEAQRITDAAFAYILGEITPNMTEREVALALEFFMRKQGAEDIAFDVIAVSGSASSLPHGVPRDVRLERGFLTMDFGARVRGYCADMTRTVVLGKADAEMKKLYDTVLLAQSEALAYLAAGGRSCHEADAVARAIIDGAGYKGAFGHSLGHGVGRYVHESPRLSPAVSTNERIYVGNVVTVEPGIYLKGKYGCRIEDMVVITENGIKNFTKSKKDLIELF